MNYAQHILIYLCMYGILATSLNIVVGYCGLMTLAHAGYFAVGCYTYSILTTRLGLDFVSAVTISFALAALTSLFISIPAWRFKGDSFVLMSLAVQQLLMGAMQNWCQPGAEPGTWTNLTNGTFGLSNIPKPHFFSFECTSVESMSVVAVGMLLCSLFVAFILLRSPWARLLSTMRDDELAARSLGKNVRLAKLQAIAISCGMAGIAGALYASYVNYVDPSVASLDESMLVLCMVLVGGVGNFRGPLVGAALLIAIPELLRFAAIPDALAANLRLMIYGVLLVVMMRWRPQGLAGALKVQ
jgi:branched-chain amino acid transport system permease protein